MQNNESALYHYTNETLSWILPIANLCLGIICIIYALQAKNIW